MNKNREVFFENFYEMKFDVLAVGCKYNNLAEKKIEELNQVLSPNEHYLYYLARTAAKNSHGRKIVTWTGMPAFNRVLWEFFGLEVAFSVAQNPNVIDNKNIYDISVVDGRQNELYIVAIHPQYTADKYRLLEEMGYLPVEDFIFRTPKPIVLENFDTSRPYGDDFGNTIEGNGCTIGKIVFRGCNNHIYIGEGVKKTEKLVFDLVANSHIRIEDECVINDSVLIEVKGVLGYSHLNIRQACRLSNAFFRIYNNTFESSIEIGDCCTFERNLEMHANSGKKIIIGRDCMFSHDVELWAGDGHSVFDVSTGKNINASTGKDSISDKIVIRDHVWVAKGAFIMHGTDIGSGSIVGARSVVKKCFPNNCSIAGNPSKIVRKDIAWGRDQVSANMNTACGEEYISYTEE